jgi:hypothetical protein
MRRFFRAPIFLLCYLFACCFALPFYAKWTEEPAYQAGQARRLVIILDGVPYQTIADLKAEGRFQQFKQPAKLISAFPSSTNPAMVEILHAEDAPGYEDHYYDRTQNRLFGGMHERVQGGKFIKGTYRETFDYHAGALRGSLAYVAAPVSTMVTAQLDMDTCLRAFKKSDAPLFVGYVGGTDSLTHLGGEWAIKNFLRTLDKSLNKLLAESQGTLTIEMLSDHGNRYDKYKHVRLNDALHAAGFETVKSLKDARSVVLPRYGLVASAQLFTWPDNKIKVAETCANTEGVDFALYYQADNSLALVAKRGRARIAQAGQRYRYDDLSGDPLRLNTIIEVMRAAGKFDAEGFADKEDWYQATREHDYPDPLRRVFEGFTSHIKNRADVMVSFADGYLIGSPLMSALAEMRATHGNLLRGESEAFAMSTRQELGGTVRGFEINQLFALHERSKVGSHLSGAGHCDAGPALAQALINPSSDAVRKAETVR